MKAEYAVTGAGGGQRVIGEDGRARLDSNDLLGGCQELIITHGSEEYRLRRTRLDKLILTK